MVISFSHLLIEDLNRADNFAFPSRIAPEDRFKICDFLYLDILDSLIIYCKPDGYVNGVSSIFLNSSFYN